MALWVRPPPQGFSQAKCSSKMVTLLPARASCSPHMAPEGPPPTIAISAIATSSWHAANPSGCETRHSVGLVSLSNMDNQQAETLEKYSTENPDASHGDVCSGTWPSTSPWIRSAHHSRGKLALRTRTDR